MLTDRVVALRALLAQDPGNTFARYGLALEQVRSGALEEAAAEFESLLAAKPDYLAAYYQYGQALEKLGRLEDAQAKYERGIETATRLGDEHTRSELQAALDLLPD
jgi:tetratricopeptide (TPR) repeat protein